MLSKMKREAIMKWAESGDLNPLAKPKRVTLSSENKEVKTQIAPKREDSIPISYGGLKEVAKK